MNAQVRLKPNHPYIADIFKKMAKKNRTQMEIIEKKVQEVLKDPYAYKPMHFPLAGMRRVHFGSFGWFTQ